MSVSANPYAPPATPTDNAVEWMEANPASLSKTVLGLSLVYYGIILFLLSIILMVAMGLFNLPPLAIVAVGGFMSASVFLFVGPLFCLSVPAETNAKGLILWTVALQVINLTFAVLPAVGVELLGFQSFSQIFGVASSICFVLFMRKLAQYVGRQDLVERARNVLILGIFVLVAAFAGVILTVAAAFGGGAAVIMLLAFVGLIFVIVMALVLFIMYANLVNALRHAIKSKKPETSAPASIEV